MKKIILFLAIALLASCTPEPQPEPNDFNQEVVDHEDDIDYNWN